MLPTFRYYFQVSGLTTNKVETALLAVMTTVVLNEEAALRHNTLVEESAEWQVISPGADPFLGVFVPLPISPSAMYGAVAQTYGRSYDAQEWVTASSHGGDDAIQTDAMLLVSLQRQMAQRDEEVRVLRTALWQQQQAAYAYGTPVNPADETNSPTEHERTTTSEEMMATQVATQESMGTSKGNTITNPFAAIVGDAPKMVTPPAVPSAAALDKVTLCPKCEQWAKALLGV